MVGRADEEVEQYRFWNREEPSMRIDFANRTLLTFAQVHSLVLAIVVTLSPSSGVHAVELRPQVEIEEVVYRYTAANNGAGPMWCHGNTSIVRHGNEVYASGLETIPEAKPMNNCLPMLFRRDTQGWKQIYKGVQRTREPSPLALFQNGNVFLSINPTLTEPDTYGGPARPEILQFDRKARDAEASAQTLTPIWEGQPAFTEHSYRSFAADGQRGEFVLFQNIGYTHAEWTFRDAQGNWSASGKLLWPYGDEYEKPQPIRVCYPNVAIVDKAVYFCGVSDIVEPNLAWKTYKYELTGRKWDYDFRRLFFTWCSDITTDKFSPWVEVASLEETCGRITPCDLHADSNGDVRLLWREQALDQRLREKFFPDAKQHYSLMLGVVRNGKVLSKTALVKGGEGLGGLRHGDGRFQVTQEGRLLVFYYVGGTDETGKSVAEHRIVEIDDDGVPSKPITVHLKTPLPTFFTATSRAGCERSNTLDLFGNSGQAMHYARIQLAE